MKNNLRETSGQWLRAAARDLQDKLERLMTQTSATVDELSRVLEIPIMEINRILGGSGTSSLESFVKIIIASGDTLAVMPQMANPYGGVPPMGLQMPTGAPFFPQERAPQDEMPSGCHFDPRQHAPHHRCQCQGHEDRMNEGRRPFAPHPSFMHEAPSRVAFNETPQRERSPFDEMSFPYLASIIRKKLWDSEIDINEASKEDLVEFLKKKDARIRQLRENEARHEAAREQYRAPFNTEEPSEDDPRVSALEAKIQDFLESNPSVKELLKKMV